MKKKNYRSRIFTLFRSNRRKEGYSPIWMTVYSDMMTNLMLFFLMLFILTRIGIDKRNEIYQYILKHFQDNKPNTENCEYDNAIVDKIRQTSKEANIKVLEINEQKIKLSLPGDVLFDSGSTELKPGAITSLNAAFDMLKGTPNKVIIEGHTDNMSVGKNCMYESNWELSQKRAQSVVNFLSGKKCLPAKSFAIAGYGEYRPVAPNDTRENMAKNRRIEIVIIRRK